MKRLLHWIWNQGILSTFLTGLFALLPLLLTVAILAWVASYIHAFLGPEGIIGGPLRDVGLRLVSNELVAWLIGLVLVLAGIWLFGVMMKSVVRHRIQRAFQAVVDRIPIVNSVYKTSAQLIGMLRKDDQAELAGMSVVFCSFGREHGAGFLCLLATPDVYRFEGRDYHLVYMPTSPIPMTGGLILVPAETVKKVDFSVEQVMRIYLSMGILAPQVMPPAHLVAGTGEPRDREE